MRSKLTANLVMAILTAILIIIVSCSGCNTAGARQQILTAQSEITPPDTSKSVQVVQQQPKAKQPLELTGDTLKDTITVFTGSRGGQYKWKRSSKTGEYYKKYLKK